MGREAEPRLHGATDGEADLLQGGEEDGKGVDSSPRRQEEEARVSSLRSPSAVASDASFRSSGAWSSSSSSSLASDVESDDGDGAYPWTQCEYEEIPSFRWIASPLRWWKPKKGSGLSRKNTAHARTATTEKEPGTPAGGSRASETSSRIVHFEGYRTFTVQELLSADAEVLGNNTYSTMYKATFGDGTQLALRRLRAEETATFGDFVTQVNLLGKIRHPNLLAPRAYYCGFETQVNPNGEKFLVFDYMPKGSLSDFLHARDNSTPMDWPTRMDIAIGVARGLQHLHTQGNMVHGNLSSVNVLLDNHVNAKVGGYGLSKLLNPAAAKYIFSFTRKTSVYNAPELSNHNKANTKTDVYSFGVIMLELLTGKSPRGVLGASQWVASITKEETTAHPEFRDTLKLASKCVDASPDVRPEMQKVLQQLEEIRSKFEKTTHSTPTTKGGNKPNDAGAAAASTITTASSATGERRTSPSEEDDIQTPWTSDNFAHDGNLLQPCASETLISSPLASSSETMPDPINSCKHKDENLPEMTPQGDLNDSEIPNPTQAEEITQNPFVDEELDALNLEEHGTGVRLMDKERCNAMSQGTGVSTLSSIHWATVDIQVHLDVPTSPPLISSDPDSGYHDGHSKDLSHNSYNTTGATITDSDLPLIEEMLQAQSSGDAEAYDGHSKDQSPATKTEEFFTESATPFMSCHIGDQVTNSPGTAHLKEEDTSLQLSDQDKSAESKRTDATDHVPSRGPAGINPALSRIDWSKLENVEVDQLQVPPSTSPVLQISSEPDLIYQSYFLTLHKLANTSPPLPSDALEGQLNRMLVGLHSMGYPLDVWIKAATLLLVSAKKREHIERYVDDYKVRLDVQVGEFTSAVNLVKEDVSRIQSDLSALEQRNQELDETIAGLVDHLAGLKLEQEKVVGELTVARDKLATAEAKAESMSIDMDRAKQQRSATLQLRDEMLQELPSIDQVFDSAFQEIVAKKF